METTTQKYCADCGSILKGRSDKKYCNDFCRNSHHNRNRYISFTHIRDINKKLLLNRRVLESMIPENEEMYRVSRERLLQEGFRFHLLTHEITNSSGAVYRYCYDLGYLLLDDQWVLLVKNPTGIIS